jgi:CRISPR-associated protein Csb1
MTTEPQQPSIDVTSDLLDRWATDPQGPVALHLKQMLEPVEGKGGVIFPPTYADIGYNIDTLSDGTRVATIDSVGSQANRLEPVFKAATSTPEEWLVPQIEIVLRREDCGECEACRNADAKGSKKKSECQNPHVEKRSILDLAHRAADAVVQSSPTLKPLVERAFRALHRSGDAGPLCSLVPTSLVFGVWDSRGGTGEKRPRLVRSIVRAWDVEPLHASAQFNSISKALDDDQRAELEKEAKAKKIKLSAKGFADAPAVFRKVSQRAAKYMQEFRDGSPNPERRVLGGILVRGRVEREVTVNLVALRGIRGKDLDETAHIRKYLLGLSLVAATADIDLFLREGCHLRYTGRDNWHAVPRRGDVAPVDLAAARTMVLTYAATGAKHFMSGWPKGNELVHMFDLKEATKLLAKETDDDQPAEE